MYDDDEEEPEEVEESGPVCVFIADVLKGRDKLRFRCTATTRLDIDAVELIPGGEENVGRVFQRVSAHACLDSNPSGRVPVTLVGREIRGAGF